MGRFPDATIEYDFGDGTVIKRMRSQADLEELSQQGGGCARQHGLWVVESDPIGEYFFTLNGEEDKCQFILFCKRADLFGKLHPQDKGGFGSYYTTDGKTIGSSLYDKAGMEKYAYLYGDDGSYYEKKYAEAKAYYKKLKERAIAQHGPLGKDHPMKWEVDDQNRHVIHCKEQMERMALSANLQYGKVFKYEADDLDLVIIQNASPYIAGENKGKLSKEQKMLMFCEKGGPISDAPKNDGASQRVSVRSTQDPPF